MAAQVKWVLCIDESGDFDTPTARVCVGGLLLQESDSSRLAQVLRANLEDAFPHLPYPPHATELHRLSSHLVGWRSLSPARRAAVPSDLAGPLTRAEQRVLAEAQLPPELAAGPGQVLPRPKVPALDRCDAWLPMRAPEARDELKAVRWKADNRLKQLLEELSRLYPGGCLTVAAAEPMGTMPGPGNDRYLNLLVVLFQRTIALLRAFQKPVHLSIRTAKRHVLRPTGVRTDLTQADVHLAFNEALRISGIGTPIHRVVVPTEDYGASVHPGLVLADHLMNQLRVQLTPRSWALLAQGFWRTTGVAVEVLDPLSGQPLPTVSANGPPRAFVEAVLTGQPHPDMAGVQPTWAVEEAKLWLSALDTRKRTGGKT